MPAMYNGEYYDSRTEAVWATYFDIVGMPYIREPARFNISHLSQDFYTPDFYLPEQDTYVEIKNGNADPMAALRAHYLARGFGRTVLLIDGKPINMSVYAYEGYTTKRPDFSRPTLNLARDLADYVFYFRKVAINPPQDTARIMKASEEAEKLISTHIDQEAKERAGLRKISLIPQVITIQ